MQDWEKIEIVDIQLTDNSDIIFLNFKTKDDVTQFTSRARNLPQDMGDKNPRLVMHVDRRASKRHKAFINMAKTIRDHSNNTVQTSVRTGKNDFLIRSRPKGDNTPWSQIPPLQIVQELPQFEIGQYMDIVNPQRNTHEMSEEQQMEEDIEDIDEIAADISNQNNENNTKRNRSNEEESLERKKANKKRSNQSTLTDTSGEESDGEANSKNILNSTPILTQNTNYQKPSANNAVTPIPETISQGNLSLFFCP